MPTTQKKRKEATMSKNYHRHEIRSVETNRNGLVCYSTFKFYTGRIKRMRKGESKCNGILRRIHGTSIVIPRNNPDMYEIMMMTQLTRWNRH